MLNQPLSEITKDIFEVYIASKESERRNVEYKERLSIGNDEEKREFLADVSSFANAIGGDLIFGVTAERDADGKTTGAPDKVLGLEGFNTDADILKLQNILRDGLDPRIPQVDFQTIDGFERGAALIIRIGQSWASPHMVKFKNASRFYSRSAAGKSQLDVREIRAAFSAAGGLAERMRAFRDNRLAFLLSGQSALGPKQSRMICVHLLPYSAFELAPSSPYKHAQYERFRPIFLTNMPTTNADERRYNLDGYLVWTMARNYDYKPLDYAKDYVQVFRNGSIEWVSTLHNAPPFEGWLPEFMAERMIQYFEREIETLIDVRFPLPAVMLVSLVGVKGIRLNIYEHRIPMEMRAMSNDKYHPIDRDVLILPDALIENFDSSPQEMLRPSLDALYQACGFPSYFPVRMT